MKVVTDLPRVHKPTVDEFMNHFVYPRKPVIITGGLEHWSAKDWSPQVLKEKIGNRAFKFRTEEGRSDACFAEMIENIERSSVDSPATYLRNIDIHTMFPELQDDIFPLIPYMENNWRNHWAWPARWPIHIMRHLTEMFISGPGVNFPRLHIDYWGMDTFVAQIYGTKEFILYSLEDTPYLYTDPKDQLISTIPEFINPDFEKYPELRKATQYRIRLEPGDLLYNPAWWHTTVTLNTSITVIMAYFHRVNYPVFVKEIARIYKDCSKIKTGALVFYFKALGFWLDLRSRKSRHPESLSLLAEDAR